MPVAPENIHVMLITIALLGHLNPMLKFARRLTRKGVNVTLATTEMDCRRMPRNKTLASDGSLSSTTAPINVEFFSDGLSPEFERDKHGEVFFESLYNVGSKNLSDLLAELHAKGMRFSCVVYNPFLPWVAEIASDHGIPCAVLWIQAWGVLSIYYHYCTNPHHFIDMEKDPNAIIRLPQMSPLAVKDLPSFILPSSPPFLKKLVLDFTRSLKKVKWVLGNSYDELEDKAQLLPIDLRSSLRSVGPLVSPAMLGQEVEEANNISGGLDTSNVESSCMKWLDQQTPNSVIYVSFGSMLILSQSLVENIAMGLKNSNRPFLWVVPPPEMAFMKAAIEGEPLHKFMEETMGRGLVVMWSPQELVLTHPAIACFVTHCGWNSAIETVSGGVPVIATPKWSDQPTNAKLLVDVHKIGVTLGNVLEDAISARGVEDCIKEVMEGPRALEMRKRAMQLREAARRALRDCGSSDKNIDDFINEITGKM
ncbi:UDP-glycosyltransferase 84B2-like [Punica granatum]|uniref:Glycosyltransferase n=2 Tax=Punica granatum TaxID=22663 RepID=A0A2I0HJL9_PUNGR|nr:UDP-glycosyltransferase 84B2-like [Punica granatum]PKI31888.1 hypothetical protein CRG98_047720 [Punica granatum]